MSVTNLVASLRRVMVTLGLMMTLTCLPGAAPAHEVLPAIADMQIDDATVTLSIRANLEGFLAGIDMATVKDTNAAPTAADYDSLRALPPAELEARFRDYAPTLLPKIIARTDAGEIPLTLLSVTVPEVADLSLPRLASFQLTGPVPDGATTAEFGWDAAYGTMAFRQNGVEAPYDGFLNPGETTPPIALSGGSKMTNLQAFLSYVPVGFDHIVPKGLDHILFVLGLFFLSTRIGTLLTQVSLFTLAHTVTLALGATGLLVVPGAFVEPVIAASIVFVAVENIISDKLSRWRPAVVFCFGLLHGLGFASVLQEFGLPEDGFFAALIGFNVGVELGQIFVIVAAFLLVGLWFRNKPWYRSRIAVPGSAVIALVGAFWFVQRTVGF